ncbi:hypothetical protein [Brevundimonas sp.]|uniref:hypothetical protein n=1 Tax=Brevundimonas sp. TaxID=1871086 RepID=UPI001A21E80B|nr:hypothetical protein [Brevundimonas sp.]MBJ7484356.1 hypothetical protein [Brevundimonas sp.]
MAFEWFGLAKLLPSTVSAVTKAKTLLEARPRKLADAELQKLNERLNTLLDLIEVSSSKAQVAVLGSSNEPSALAANEAAVETSILVGQKVASLFELTTVGGASSSLMGMRMRYREAVANDENIGLTGKAERQARCAEIEAACDAFHSEVCSQAWRRYGQGVGARAGRLKDRKLPK